MATASKLDPVLEAYKSKEAMLTAKIQRLAKKELNAEIQPGDGRQEEAIERNEQYLREVRTEIAKLEKKAPKHSL